MDTYTNQSDFLIIPGCEVSHRFVNIGDIHMHIAEAGSGDPLIMLHGWPQHWYMWHEQIKYFSPYYHVIAPDIRGFGWSEAPKESYLKDDLADDLKKLIHALGYRSVLLMSHDWGGWIGFIASAKYPGLIKKHFATNICPIWPKISWRMIPATIQLGYMFRIAFGGKKMLLKNDDFISYIFSRDNTNNRWYDQEMKIYSDRFRDPARAYASMKLYRDFLIKEYVPLGFMGKYHHLHLYIPTYILFGKNDFAISLSWLRGYDRYADDITIELIPDVGHFIVNEEPDLVNQRAATFFNPKTINQKTNDIYSVSNKKFTV